MPSASPTIVVPTMQATYDVSTQPVVTVNSTVGALSIRDNGTQAVVQQWEDSGGNSKLEVGVGAVGERPGIRVLPNAFTQTVLPTITYALQWDSTVTTSIAGGAPFGNDTAPAMVGAIGECIFTDPGNLFSSSLLFNQGTTLTAQANLGPVYTMVNQPKIRADGASYSCSQHNALRIQPSWGPNLNGGSITQTSAVYILNTAFVDATVGTASVTTLTYWQALSPTLTAGGTIGTLNAIDIANISGPTTVRGINSAMSSGTFINHTGTAPSSFNGNLTITNTADLLIGSTSAVTIDRSAASVLRLSTTVATPLTLSMATADVYTWEADGFGDATPDGEIRWGAARFAFGQTSAVGNQVGVFVANTRTVAVAGEWSDFLLTQAGNITVDAAMTLVAGWTVNAPSITLGTGTVTTAGVLNVGGNVNEGSVNRFGVRILSNPSGGSGVNAALWVTAGLSRFDGRVDINNGVALGGGLMAVLGTIGGSGPTTATQAQWVEIDIGGTAHWLAAWT